MPNFLDMASNQGNMTLIRSQTPPTNAKLVLAITLSPSSSPGPRKELADVRFALSKLLLKTSIIPSLQYFDA
jgi:hypothetical protein